MVKIPKCCGNRMTVNIETERFVELWCETCDDMVYIKKDAMLGPQLIDD